MAEAPERRAGIDDYEKDSEAKEEVDLTQLLIPGGSFPPLQYDKFGVVYSQAALKGWVKQPSPCCCGASIAGELAKRCCCLLRGFCSSSSGSSSKQHQLLNLLHGLLSSFFFSLGASPTSCVPGLLLLRLVVFFGPDGGFRCTQRLDEYDQGA
jgi:hypothetical protein